MKRFPNRIIVWTDLTSMSRQSFGLIVFCRKTGRTLIVQVKDSPEFLHFIRGFFRKTDIPGILGHCTLDEHLIISKLCNLCPSDRRTFLLQLLKEKFSTEQASKHLETSLKRIAEDLKIIKENLRSILPQKDHHWLWPKGGINRDEQPLECAIRETKEESGLQVPLDQILTEKKLSVEATSFYGNTFKTTYFVALVDDEMKSDEFDRREIAKVEWVTLEDAKDRMSASYQKLFSELKGIPGTPGTPVTESSLDEIEINNLISLLKGI